MFSLNVDRTDPRIHSDAAYRDDKAMRKALSERAQQDHKQGTGFASKKAKAKVLKTRDKLYGGDVFGEEGRAKGQPKGIATQQRQRRELDEACGPALKKLFLKVKAAKGRGDVRAAQEFTAQREALKRRTKEELGHPPPRKKARVNPPRRALRADSSDDEATPPPASPIVD